MGACAWLVQECAHSRVRPCARHGYKSFLRDGTNGVRRDKEMPE